MTQPQERPNSAGQANTPAGAPAAQFATKFQVFEPHRASMPPLKPYLKEFWERRAFAFELAHFADKAEYLDAKFGKVWLVLNPLLLSMIYFLLVTVIRGSASTSKTGLTTLAHILIGIFTFYFAQNIINDGAQSITSGGRLILNQAFPRTLLVFSSAIRSFWQFLPTIPVYFFVIGIGKLIYPKTHIPLLDWNYLWVPVIIAVIMVTAFGLSLIFATLNVYFRDTSKLLNYITRIWLYCSPVLWLPSTMKGWHQIFIFINPLGPAIAATSNVWVLGISPTHRELAGAAIWALICLVFGGWIFISRERDFAVRI